MGSQHSQMGVPMPGQNLSDNQNHAQIQGDKDHIGNNGTNNNDPSNILSKASDTTSRRKKTDQLSSSNESMTLNPNNINRFSNSDSDCSSLFGANDNRLSGNSDYNASQQNQPNLQQQQPAQPQIKQADLVNIVFTWNFGGQNVCLIGSFNKWQERIQMKKNGNEFTLVKTLERGVHTYKFIVDNDWRFAPDQPTCRDSNGNINNFIDTTNYAPVTQTPLTQSQAQPSRNTENQAYNHAQTQRKRRGDTNTGQTPATSSYGQQMPNLAEINQDAQVMPIHFQYNFLNRDDIPLHNEKYSKPSLNKDVLQGNKSFFDNQLDLPSHVVINHVNTWRDQSEQMTVISIAQRLNKTKFVTTMYYKPCQEEEGLFD